MKLSRYDQADLETMQMVISRLQADLDKLKVTFWEFKQRVGAPDNWTHPGESWQVDVDTVEDSGIIE